MLPGGRCARGASATSEGVSARLHGTYVPPAAAYLGEFCSTVCACWRVSVCFLFFLFAQEYVRVHRRHQGVLIYSNELGRITRGWWGEGRMWGA